MSRALPRLLADGLVAGSLSGVPSAMGLLAGHGRPVEATREIGRFVFGRPSTVLGGVAHLGFSTAFAAPAPVLARRGRPALAGAAYGVALYTVNFGLVAPRLWPQVRAYGGRLQLADHVAYGVALALVSPSARRARSAARR